MKYCSYCGAQINDDAIFCRKCGANQNVHSQPRTNDGNGTSSNQTINTQPSFNQQSYIQAYKKVEVTPPSCSMDIAWSKFWNQYFKGNGYSSRSEYWYLVLDNFMLWIFIGAAKSIFMNTNFYHIIAYAAMIFALSEIIPNISLICRRMRDAGAAEGMIVTTIVCYVLSFSMLRLFDTDAEMLSIFGITSLVVTIIIFVYSILPSVRYVK